MKMYVLNLVLQKRDNLTDAHAKKPHLQSGKYTNLYT